MTAEIIPLPTRTPKKRISVVMVSYHTGAPLWEAMQAVLADDDILELILVDNANSPAVRKRIWEFAKDRPRLRLVQGQRNVGFGRACNYGARLAKGEYILFLNPDAVILKGSAMAMADCGENLQQPWITGGFLETISGHEQRGARRDKLTPLNAFVSFTPLHKIPGFKSIHLEHTPRPTEPVAMPTVSGACMMMDRGSFEKLSGFDPRYFLHVEDIEICARVRKEGGDVFFVPSAKVMHYGSTSDARVQNVEYEKLKGFLRYFWDYSPKWWARLMVIATAPFMSLAIMGRAWWLAIRAVWRG